MKGFECAYLPLDDGEIACWHRPADAGLGKPILLLGHGNGLSALTQIDLMTELSATHDVRALDFRGHGASRLPLPAAADPWPLYVEDLRQVIDRHFNAPVTYAGHSLGAVVALRLARQSPALFRALIAIDPAILPRWLTPLYPALSRFDWFAKHNSLYAGALRRRETWASFAEAVAYFTGRKALSIWPPSAVHAYVHSALKMTQGGTCTLACPRAWEARTFRYVACEVAGQLKHVRSPYLLIRAHTGAISPPSLHLGEYGTLAKMPGSHFLHLEGPADVCGQISKYLTTNFT